MNPKAMSSPSLSRKIVCLLAGILTLTTLAGCQGSASGSKGSSAQGKTYKPDTQGKQASGQGSQNGNSTPRTPAETVSGQPSAASDGGTPDAANGQVVLNPGAPPQHKPAKH